VQAIQAWVFQLSPMGEVRVYEEDWSIPEQGLQWRAVPLHKVTQASLARALLSMQAQVAACDSVIAYTCKDPDRAPHPTRAALKLAKCGEDR
jgi:hypothetical protein